MTTDPISEMLVRIKNAGNAGKTTVVVPHSKVKLAIAEILEREGYIKSISKKGKKIAKVLELELLYTGDLPRIKDVKRLSKPSRRIYQAAREIRHVRHGFGRLILSTPKGLMTDREARKAHVGGEALFKIW
ncbi:MAG: 30S ribosomal protein S8 [bacterium]|nr:30S ribosomal protein S8 [bacterium]